MDELKEMQLQLNSMRESLAKSRIVNNRLLRQIIKRKAGFLNNIVTAEVLTFPLLLLFMTAFCLTMRITLWLMIVFAVCAGIDVILDFKNIRVTEKLLYSSSLTQLRQKLLIQKKHRKLQNAIMFPLTILWLLWLCFEIVKPWDFSTEVIIGIFSIFSIFILLAIILIILLIRKIDRTTDDLVADIDESENENNEVV